MVRLSSILRYVGCFKNAQTGSVAIIFAISILPMMSLIGAGVDYGAVLASKTELDAYADSAVLIGADPSIVSDPPSVAQAKVINAFNSAKSNVRNNVTVTAFTATVTDNATTRTVTINYTASRPTNFVGLLGVPTMSFSGTATAQTGRATYMDFHLLLDNTPSMAVGATLRDIDRLERGLNCAFACHIDNSKDDTYAWAKANGATLRIDMVRQATQSLMDTASSTQKVPGQYRVAIHTFGTSCSNLELYTLTNLTSNLATVKAMAGKINVMGTPAHGYNEDKCTDYVKTFQAANNAISPPGKGDSAATPQKVLFFVGDGVNGSTPSSFGCDSDWPPSSTRCIEPINTYWCTAMKERGIKIAVLYTTYLPLPTNDFYNDFVAPFRTRIPKKMQECASPGLYFQVSPTQGIAEAMKALFEQTIARAKLIN